MKTAEEYRHEYYILRGRTITPCSFLADVLNDLEEREAEVRFLQAALIAPADPLLQEELAR